MLFPGICLGFSWHRLSLLWGGRPTYMSAEGHLQALGPFPNSSCSTPSPTKGRIIFLSSGGKALLAHCKRHGAGTPGGAGTRWHLGQTNKELHTPEPNSAGQCLLCPGTGWPVPAGATGIYSGGRRGGILQWQKQAVREERSALCTGALQPHQHLERKHMECSHCHHGRSPGRPQDEVSLWFGGTFFKMRKVVFSQGKARTSSTHTEINFRGSQTWHKSYESYLNELFVLYKKALHRFLWVLNKFVVIKWHHSYLVSVLARKVCCCLLPACCIWFKLSWENWCHSLYSIMTTCLGLELFLYLGCFVPQLHEIPFFLKEKFQYMTDCKTKILPPG